MQKVGHPTSEDTPSEALKAVKLEAPVVLTPDQIQQIAAGAMSFASKGKLVPTTRLGFWPIPSRPPTIPGSVFKA